MTRVISIEDLKGLFTKPYGEDAPTKQKWAQFYNENGKLVGIPYGN